jgi:predicted glycogen debranching enzyme
MNPIVRRMTRHSGESLDETALTTEWIVTNGLGGYASGTVYGVATRRYHGLLIAALPAPLGRMMMLNHLSEQVRLPDGSVVSLHNEERVPQLQLENAAYLRGFHLELGLPVWTYSIGNEAIGPIVIEKRLFLPRHQNSVHIHYRLLEGPETLRLKLMPSVHFRSHDAHVSTPIPEKFHFQCVDDRFELSAGSDLPTLRLTSIGDRVAFTIERRFLHEMLYRIEESRGYDSVGDQWSPGYFRFDLSRRHPAIIIASTEPWETITALSPADALQSEIVRRERLLATAPAPCQSGAAAELVLAADQFLIRPVGRVQDMAIAKASGEEGRSVIAGYHWFTDWGRDTMISLEGLTLSTGRHAEAGFILRTFAHYVRDGLIPNMFPEGGKEGLYHTADATLWFFHALDRYLAATRDTGTLQHLLPTLREIHRCHVEGTRFHIGVDHGDGLLSQGEEGYQLTWMDAKMGDWVVTPRRGKAVEINALWYNAVSLLASWIERLEGSKAAAPYRTQADGIKESFNRRFWNPATGYLFDVVDGETGDDPACRPNQLFSISLPNAVLDRERWTDVLEVCRTRLLTPAGLRSLAPSEADYKPNYHGDLRTRDAAYHQGTVWSWLIGPYIDAFVKVHPGRPGEGKAALDGLIEHLGEACLGTVSEVFDAEAPFTPRGCCSQAWGVAELLRCCRLLETLDDR